MTIKKKKRSTGRAKATHPWAYFLLVLSNKLQLFDICRFRLVILGFDKDWDAKVLSIYMQSGESEE